MRGGFRAQPPAPHHCSGPAPRGTGTAEPGRTGTITAMTAKSPSWAVTRNAALRALLRVTYPSVTFAVRNGTFGSAAVTWTDGPPAHAVRRTLNDSPVLSYRPDRIELTRQHSLELTVVGFLRTRADGFGDTLLAATVARDWSGTRPSDEWASLAHYLDAAQVSAAEWSDARTAIALAQVREPSDTVGRAYTLALFLTHHGDLLDAVTSPTAPAGLKNTP